MSQSSECYTVAKSVFGYSHFFQNCQEWPYKLYCACVCVCVCIFFFCYFITSSQGVQENCYPTDHSFVTNFSPEGNVPLRLSNRNDWIYCTKMTQKCSSPCCILSSINTENNRRFISSYIEKKEKKEKKTLCSVIQLTNAPTERGSTRNRQCIIQNVLKMQNLPCEFHSLYFLR